MKKNKDALKRFRVGNINDPAYRTYLLDAFLRAVYLYDDKLVLVLNYNGENSKISLDTATRVIAENKAECFSLALFDTLKNHLFRVVFCLQNKN